MASTREIRRRIRGVQSTARITRAMEMIANSKMKRAQERGLAGRPYSEKIRQVIADLEALPREDRQINPLLQSRPVKKIAILHMTPNRGLCGGLDGNLNRNAVNFIVKQEVPVAIIAIGRRGFDFMRRHGRDVRAGFPNLSDRPNMADILPISRIVQDDYTSGFVDEVYVNYARFTSTTIQKPEMVKILPVEPAKLPAGHNVDYIFEPSADAVLGELLPRFVEMLIYHYVLESIASEQSARMVAMRNATDNANELTQDLTLIYNKVRQESITREILEVTSGAVALR